VAGAIQGSLQIKKKDKLKKGKATMHDLPPVTGMKFGAILIPNVKAYVGSIPAWAEPNVGMLKTMWSNVFGRVECSTPYGTSEPF
jgi:hypothetical protein